MLTRIAGWLGYRRCRFCQEWVRHGRDWRGRTVHQLVGSVCHGCYHETMRWLDSLGAMVTWPLPED